MPTFSKLNIASRLKPQAIDQPFLVDARLRNQVTRLLAITFCLVLSSLFLCELIARFIVYVGKPALSENVQYHVKYLVAKTLRSDQDNIVFCGDSLMKAGIYPELVAAKLGAINKHIRCVNLAANGANQADAIIFLDFLRRRQIKPKLVVFDYEVSNTGSDTSTSTAYSAGSNRDAAVKKPPSSTSISGSSSRIDLNLAPTTNQASSRGYLFEGLLSRPSGLSKQCEMICSDYLYLVRHRANIKQFIFEYLKALKFPQRFERKAFVEPRDWNDNGTTSDGMSPNHKLIPEEDRLQQKKAIWPFHASSPQSVTYRYLPDAYSPIVKYCREWHIALILLWLPHQSSIYREFYYQAPYTESWFRQRFEDYAKEDNVIPLYLNTLEEDPNYYTDYRHLSTYGCIETSELLAKTLGQPKYLRLLKH